MLSSLPAALIIIIIVIVICVLPLAAAADDDDGGVELRECRAATRSGRSMAKSRESRQTTTTMMTPPARNQVRAPMGYNQTKHTDP